MTRCSLKPLLRSLLRYCLPALLYAAAPVWAFDFSWGSASVPWINGDLGPQVFTNVDGSGITVTVELTGNTGNMTQNTPALFQPTGALPDELRVFPDFADKTETVTTTLTFSEPVTIDGFIVKDLDGINNRWADGVIVTVQQASGFDGSPNDVTAGSLITEVNSNQFEPQTSTAVDYTDPSAWLTTSYNLRQVVSIAITLYPAPLAAADPDPGAIVLSDFRFFRELPLEITKTADVTGPLNPGELLNYTITLTNTRPEAQFGVELKDALPTGLTYQSASTVVTGFVPQPSATDDFSSGDFTGGSGWSGNWIKVNPANTPLIQVIGGRARFEGVAGPDPYLTRTVAQDLSTADGVVLSFELDTSRNLDNDGDNDDFEVFASSDGGANWTLLVSYRDDVIGPQSLDITAFASAQTAIRYGVRRWTFPANGNNALQYFYVDDVVVTATFPNPPSTSRDNAPGGFPNLVAGTPPDLVLPADNFYLPAGQSMTATFAATVDLPSAMSAINLAAGNSSTYPDAREAMAAVPVVSSCSINAEPVAIRAQADDGYWQPVPGISSPFFYRSFIDLGNAGTLAGLRFLGITIPAGAVVSAATLELTGFTTDNTGNPQVSIVASDSASAPAFGTSPPNSLTTASVTWALGAVTSGVALQSPNLQAIVQELVDSYGGLDNAALALLLQGSGDIDRRLRAYGGMFDSGNASLSISWQCPPTDYGDAPLSYGEASHLLAGAPGVYLGMADVPDAESAQLYSADAEGDDSDPVVGGDDENGVSFRSPAGTSQSIFADVDVVTDRPVTVCGWLDRPDGVSGDFGAADGQCQAVNASSLVTFQWANLPRDVQYTTFARFRVSSDALSVADATGAATDGEAEDYQLQFNFTPTSAVIDNFRVGLVRVGDLQTLSALPDAGVVVSGRAGQAGAGSGPGAGASEPFAEALAGLDGDAQIAVVQWETLQERGTQGFYVERRSGGQGRWTRLNAARLLPGLIVSPLGGDYVLLDTRALGGEEYEYRLIEQEIWGSSRVYGPWKVVIGTTAAVGSISSQRHRQGRGENQAESQWGHWRSLQDQYAARPRKALSKKKESPAKPEPSSQQAGKAGKKANPALRLRVLDAGLQRLPLATLVELSGKTPEKLQRELRKRRWQLRSAGKNLPYYYHPDAQALYFVGESLRSTETLENVYQLTRKRGSSMKLIKGVGPAAVSPGQFREQIVFEENPFLLPYIHSEEAADYGYWDYVNSNGKPSATLLLPIPDPVANGANGLLRVTLRGVLDPKSGIEQRAWLALNGAVLPGDISWSGNDEAELVVPFAAAQLLAAEVVDGVVQASVTIYGEPLNGAAEAVFMIDRIALEYDRGTIARNDQLWLHELESGVVTVSGFSSSDIRLVAAPASAAASWREDLTLEQTADGSWQASFTSEGGDYLLSSAPLDATVEVDLPSTLARRKNGADYLIIAPRELAESARALADYRSQRFGEVSIAWLQDIYDEFSDGRTDSAAIQAFLRKVYRRWRQVPEYVLLLGRGTLDHPNTQGYGDSLIPVRLAATPWGLAPSDNRYADIDGDHVPEFLLGRISASNNAEAMAYLDKLAAYEAAAAGVWSQLAVVVADNPDAAGDFYQNADEAAMLLTQAGYGVESLYHPQVPVGAGLRAGLQAGAWALINYSGHGVLSSLGKRSEDFLNLADVPGLTNTPQLPVFAALTCGALDSSYPGQLSLGDALVNQPGGGSIASFAATGLSLDTLAQALNLVWLQALVDGESIAEAARRARAAGYTAGMPSYMLDIYSVAGDPAVELKFSE